MRLMLLAVPAAFVLLTLLTRKVFFKVGATVSNALLVLLGLLILPQAHRETVIVAAALAVSAVGDWFLAVRGKRVRLFIAGIGAFLLAHVGFLVFALLQGRMVWPVFAILAAVYAAFHFFGVRPRTPNRTFSAAVFAYMIASCASFAAACGMGLPPIPKWLFVSGIALVMASDTFIGLREFLCFRKVKRLILPTYYLGHMGIVAAILLWGGA